MVWFEVKWRSGVDDGGDVCVCICLIHFGADSSDAVLLFLRLATDSLLLFI